MKNIKFLVLLIFILFISGCAHQSNAQRDVAAESCINKLKPEYHSYFDSVEKCLDNSSQQ